MSLLDHCGLLWVLFKTAPDGSHSWAACQLQTVSWMEHGPHHRFIMIQLQSFGRARPTAAARGFALHEIENNRTRELEASERRRKRFSDTAN